jgi:asparagine synthase (glutamine-hydrolysing)
MCGIAGYQGDVQFNSFSDLKRAMEKRGPDNFGKTEHSRTKLFHSRLSIIDKSHDGNQPFTYKEYSVVFNGEIYNYLELRSILSQKGYTFQTSTDTEVLIKIFHCYGVLEGVKMFEGMFSIALFNRVTEKLYLISDRFAEKPIFYYESKEAFFFGSERRYIELLSSRRFDLNLSKLRRFVALGYKALYKDSQDFLIDMEQVPPANIISIENGRVESIVKYYQVEYKPDDHLTFADCIEQTKKLFTTAVNLRLRSDVPLGFCLSGGVDSASVVSMAASIQTERLRTYTMVDPDERYSEGDLARLVAEKYNTYHTEIPINDLDSPLERLIELIRERNAPVATISYLIHSYLIEELSSDSTVSFSGTAADELFTGYYDHFLLHIASEENSVTQARLISEFNNYQLKNIRNGHLRDPLLYVKKPNFRLHVFQNGFDGNIDDFVKEIMHEERYSSNLLRNRMLNELYHEGTRVILREDDANSMYYSVENRSPFLDSKLVDFAYSIPNKYLIGDGFGKNVLRKAMDGIVPDEILTARKKKGFNTSFLSVFRKDLDKIHSLLKVERDFMDNSHYLDLLGLDYLTNSQSKGLFNYLCSIILIDIRDGIL